MTTPTSFRGDEGATADELAAASPLAEMTAEQDAHAQQYAIEFLSKVIRIRGVAVSRQDYLRQELRKLGTSDAQIGIALESTPLNAGIALDRLDELAASTIDFETRKSAAMSFTAGLTGGFAMLATVPADITQYHVHALRIIQKLVYLYGWQDLLSDLDEADDETVGRLALFFGVMMGVGGVISGSMTLVEPSRASRCACSSTCARCPRPGPMQPSTPRSSLGPTPLNRPPPLQNSPGRRILD